MKEEFDVIVFLEISGENSYRVNRGLLSEGHRIARLLGGNLAALTLGPFIQDPGLLQAHGVSTLYHVEGSGLAEYNGEGFAWAAATALKDLPRRLVLLAHTDMGSLVAACLAPYLGSAAILDCVDVRVRNGQVVYAKAVHSGQFEREIWFTQAAPEIATLRTDLLNIREAPAPAPPSVVTIPLEIPPNVIRTRRIESLPPDAKTVDILYSDRIIGTGYGCRESDLIGLVHELSVLLESSVGATRPVVDDGGLPHVRMIGQTGKTVAPELYLALGISGSPHHMSGIQQSKKILSVNQDPSAPIFNFSDAGFVADLKIFLPKLIARIKQYQGGSLA